MAAGDDWVLASFAGRFGRVEPRRTAAGFVAGLLAEIEVKTCWQLVEEGAEHRDLHQAELLLMLAQPVPGGGRG